MSIPQVYFLAHKARAKLSSEASRADHDLRLLVGHANLLDTIMFELGQAEQRQEPCFIQSAQGATKNDDRHQWPLEEREQDWANDADYSGSDSDSDDDDMEIVDTMPPICRTAVLCTVSEQPFDDIEMMDEDHDEDSAQLARQQSIPSHLSAASPPELDLHSDESSEDENMTPPSPPDFTLPAFSEKQDFFFEAGVLLQSDTNAFYDEGFYLPPRNADKSATAISVC